MSTEMTKCVEDKLHKHTSLNEAIEKLYDIVGSLKDFTDRVENGDVPKENTPKGVVGNETLAWTLDNTPTRINENIDKISDQISKLNSLLF